MVDLVEEPGSWAAIGCASCALAEVLVLRRTPTRGRVLRTEAATGAVLGGVAAAQYATDGASLDAIGGAALVPVPLGIVSAFLVLAVLPLLEWVLGELSDVSLVEYGTDHRLLDDLRYAGSRNVAPQPDVADLAERAAAEIGARALFCKTAALYRDIGKLNNGRAVCREQ